MRHGRIFFCTFFAILLLLGFLSSASGGEADLFQKVGAKQMKVKKSAPNFFSERLEWSEGGVETF